MAIRKIVVSAAAATVLGLGVGPAAAADLHHYTASPQHIAAVAALADDSQGAAVSDTPVVQPAPVQPAGYSPQGVTGQQVAASGAVIGATTAAGIGLLIAVIIGVRKGTLRWGWAIAAISLGVLLAPTFVGPLVNQLSSSLGSSLGNVWTGL